MRRHTLFWLSAGTVFVLDRITKLWAETTLPFRESVPGIPHVVQWTLSHNPGAAGGLFAGHLGWLVLISVLAAIGILWFVLKGPHDRNWCLMLGLGLMLGGNLGNLFDRIFYQYVIDFIDPLGGDYIANVADKGIHWGLYLSIVGLFLAWLRRSSSQKGNFRVY